MKYRKFLSLTDEEIIFIVSKLLTAKKVCNIKRYNKGNYITCDATTSNWEVDNELIDIEDEITLSIPSFEDEGFTAHDFGLNEEELWLWSQWLLAKGCDERLKNNPFLMNNIESNVNKLETMFIDILKLKNDINKDSTWVDATEQLGIFVEIVSDAYKDALYIAMEIRDIDTNETFFDCVCDYDDNSKIIEGCEKILNKLKELEK